MMHHIWKLADLNIQHRMFNAILKEHIFPEQMFFKSFDKCLELQYKGQALNVNYIRKSPLMRYVFEGEIRYIKGDASFNIESLEQLLELLTNQFDIPISTRLTAELQSSREGLAMSYEHFNNRQSNIRDSLNFSRMPITINFFTWLQHMKEDNDVNDLIYSESLVVEGHPTHPLTKTKLPLTNEEVKLYAPEFEKIIPLKIMLIHKQFCMATAMEDDEQYIINQVIPEYKVKIKAFLDSHDLDLADYRIIFVHPWQYENVIPQQFGHWIETQRLVATPFDLESKATLSFRTMELLNKPFHVKLPINVQATSAVRTVSAVTTVDGPKLSYELQDMMDVYPQLKVALEPYGIYADTDEDIARQLACIVRYQPQISNTGLTIVTGSLVNRNPVDNQIIVDSYIEWLGLKLTKETIKKFISNYALTLIKPLIAYIQDYGVALEAHMQNTIVNLNHDFKMKFMIRDLGGSRIDLDTLKAQLPNINVTNKSLIVENIEAVIAKFQHAVIQNQISELIHHFTQYDGIEADELFDLVREAVEQSIDSKKAHAHILRQTLFGAKINVKALLRMRMEGKVKNYLTVDLDNPLSNEV
ncbi:siderophore synthetase [Staphylococcus cohnii]|uniref:IucA/IucC family protein n=1 Tax=Staphylococcus cohnii TaxID=29382 RepID=UPI0015E5C71D|nr:IucA/IucC family protein [Staphylococcus cohnii]MBA1353488.1 siderophore synthetase [Staphylococcus cohnii]MBA1390495.1 siderophore synthetase [Staphylococcus cohnii]